MFSAFIVRYANPTQTLQGANSVDFFLKGEVVRTKVFFLRLWHDTATEGAYDACRSKSLSRDWEGTGEGTKKIEEKFSLR